MLGVTLTNINRHEGVCGFCSALAAAESRRGLAAHSDFGVAEDTVLRSLRVYLIGLLRDRKIPARAALLADIESFTQSFGGNYANFTVQDFVTSHTWTEMKWHGVAMPPSALVDFLRTRRVKGRITSFNNPGATNVIVGLGRGPGGRFGGLRHWVYMENARRVFNWGEVKTMWAVQQETKLNPICMIQLL